MNELPPAPTAASAGGRTSGERHPARPADRRTTQQKKLRRCPFPLKRPNAHRASRTSRAAGPPPAGAAGPAALHAQPARLRPGPPGQPHF
eukprot:11171230-Lingulodinium_polyedra.AAC.1